MDKIFEINDDAGFLGLVNTTLYRSFIAEEFEFDEIKARIISESNKGHLLFWGTERPDIWQVRISDQTIAPQSYRHFKGKIRVNNNRLHLINYESITVVAQFEEDQLPEEELADLYVTLDNGIYDVGVYQLLNLEEDEMDENCIGFEIVLQKSTAKISNQLNSFSEITWSQY